MPINAIILIAPKWRQTSEERFLNRKYVSGRWNANVHPNIHVDMQHDNISYDNVLYLIPRSQFLQAKCNLAKYNLQSATYNLSQAGTSNKI